jgi:hypothetical protein
MKLIYKNSINIINNNKNKITINENKEKYTKFININISL